MSSGYFLDRDKTFLPATIVKETRKSRLLSVTLANGSVVQHRIHPTGVAWPGLYPRFFALDAAPTGAFVYRGRALAAGQTMQHPAIPSVNPHYRFQPFTADLIDAANHAEPVLLTGGTGVGKTSHVLQIAARIHQPVLRINFNGETRLSDLIGKLTVVDGATRWSDGVLPQAMRNGWWLLLDEIDFAEPAVLSLLHPVLEDAPTLTLKEHGGEVIRPHPLFRIFATANSIGAMQERAGSYAGTTTMNDAFLDRWQVLLVDNLPPQEERRVLLGEVPGLSPRWARRLVEFAALARQSGSEIAMRLSGDNFSTRRVLAWARKTALHRSPLTGAQKAWLDKVSSSDQEAVLRILHTHFGGKRTKTTPRSPSQGRVPSAAPAGGTLTASGKRRGRPPKSSSASTPPVTGTASGKRRGRPPKSASVAGPTGTTP